MAWNKFAHLSNRYRLDDQGPDVKNPAVATRRQTLPAVEAQRADMLSLLMQVGDSPEDSGAAIEKPAIVNRFMQNQLERKRKTRPNTGDWLPGWAREAIEQKASPEELVRLTADRLLRSPSEEAFLDAEVVINEMGRDEKGTALLKQYLGQEFMQKLTRMMQPSRKSQLS